MKQILNFRPGKATLILAGAFAILVLLIATRPGEAPEPRREQAWVVDVVPAKATTLRPTLELFGRVQSPQNAELSAARRRRGRQCYASQRWRRR